LPPKFRDLARTAPNRAALELHKDFVFNTRFRRDVFVKPEGPAAPAGERGTLFADLSVLSTVLPSQFKAMAVDGPAQFDLTAPIFTPLVAALADGARQVSALHRLPTLASFPLEALKDALLLLIMSRQAATTAKPTQRPATPPAVPGDRPPLAIPDRFNRIVLEQRLADGSVVILASRSFGNGIQIVTAEALALLALIHVPRDQAARWGADFFARHKQALLSGGKPVPAGEATAALLEQAIDGLLTRSLTGFIEREQVVAAA